MYFIHIIIRRLERILRRIRSLRRAVSPPRVFRGVIGFLRDVIGFFRDVVGLSRDVIVLRGGAMFAALPRGAEAVSVAAAAAVEKAAADSRLGVVVPERGVV